MLDLASGIQESDYSELKALISEGWRALYAEFFGRGFVEALDSAETDDQHHSQAIEWHWNARLCLINYELELRQLRIKQELGVINYETFARQQEKLQDKWFPPFWAYTAIWSRGNMKTTVARATLIVDALLSVAFGVSGYGLVVGGTVKKVKGTATTISQMLQSPKIKQYAPKLSQVKKSDAGQSQGWTADFINTAAGYVFHFIGLDQGIAGANVEGVRPTYVLPDDIDDREDSPVISEGRLSVLTRSVIPTKQWNTLFFFAQNMISRFSVLYRIYKQQVRVLANRFATEPIPAVRGLETEERLDPDSGLVRDFFTSGKITWRGWNRREVQNQIDTMTLPIFLLECQHEVEGNKEGLVHKKYNDAVHPISKSQLAAVYGSRDAWKTFNKVPFNDWARTKTAYHANVAGYVCVVSQNRPLPGHMIIVPLSFPKDTTPADVAVRMLSVLQPATDTGKPWADLVDEAWKRAGEHEFKTESDRLDFQKKYYAKIIPKYARPVLKRYRVKSGVNSHSEDKVREIFNQGFGFSFMPSNPGENEGLEDIDAWMKYDRQAPHCFDQSKTGYTRFHVLCEDDTTKEPTIINGIEVYPPEPYPDVIEPDKLHDAPLFRYQMCNRSYADPEVTKTGEKIDVLLKMNDDFGQCLQMIAIKKLLSNMPLTKEEEIEETMPEGLTQTAIDSITDDDNRKSLTLQRRLQTINAMQREQQRKVVPAGIARRRKR